MKTNHNISEKEFLRQYDINQFDRPSLTVDILIFTILEEKTKNYRKQASKSLNILLIKRNEHPYKNKWALPGGFVRIDEDLDTTAYRELKEETNVSNVYLQQLKTYGNINRDPRGRIVSTAYMSLIDAKSANLKASTDAADTKWFKVTSQLLNHKTLTKDHHIIEVKNQEITLVSDDITLKFVIKTEQETVDHHKTIKQTIVQNDDLAFDHPIMIQEGIKQLRDNVESTNIVFNLMPPLFTLTELQSVYEIILGKSLLKANFRRKIAKKVIETDEMSKEKAGHRPAKLYQFNLFWDKDIDD